MRKKDNHKYEYLDEKVYLILSSTFRVMLIECPPNNIFLTSKINVALYLSPEELKG